MFAKAANRIVDKLESNNLITPENREIYVYGFQQGFTILWNFISMILIGLLFQQVLECIIYLMFYFALRIYAGGYHASTVKRCYLCSCVMISAALFVIKVHILNIFICAVISFLSGVVIFFFSPVEDKNKKLDQKEVFRYRLFSRVILMAELAIQMICSCFRWDFLIFPISLSLLTLAIMLIVGKIKNRLILHH